MSHYLAEHFSLRGAAEAAVLLISVLTVWSYTSWAATMIPVGKVSSSIMVLAVTVMGLLMNASISKAFSDAAWSFLIPLLTIQIGRTLWTIISVDDKAYRAHFGRVLVWLVASTPLWIAGALYGPEERLYFWAAAALFELLGAYLAHPLPGKRLQSNELPFDAEHMLERYNLFLIIALGETVLMTGVSIAQSPMNPMTLFTGTLAMLITISLWALIFGSAQQHTERHIRQTADPVRVSRYAMNAITTMVAGLIILAVANEKIIHHPTGHAKLVVGLMVSGGPAIFLITQSVFLKCVLNVSSHKHWIGGVIIAFSGFLMLIWPPYAVLLAVCLILVFLAGHDRFKVANQSSSP
ncbi:low temperature requirement protein A [Marinobacterium mangrovicola]|uniref:low temperature requirement protein A n=1 Tax=Marinobacterium mangrovicola TaxID=1476959 RepID=UPI001A9E1B5F|nr:low temperature requirement protein A [Marinobacterium mangrovicola]